MRRERYREIDEDDGGGDEDDNIPLHRKKPFGAGLKRKRIEFVPATKTEDDASTASQATAPSAADLYASVVLRSREPEQPSASGETCDVCSLPITTSPRQHALSAAHQVSLAHSHPPSSLDRSRMGLRTLQSQGWDPDARRGLGLNGEGVPFPLKAEAKHDNRGIGAAAQTQVDKSPKPAAPATKQQRAKSAAEERKKATWLQTELYSRVDVERYLRGDDGRTGIAPPKPTTPTPTVTTHDSNTCSSITTITDVAFSKPSFSTNNLAPPHSTFVAEPSHPLLVAQF
ncbi:hypothetical protein CP533_6762 [Ophiocordyceps camponoti-saundersi (nom. inval.)]|nr:hypothetical protein CP533_6762 [Ophiocordyceps camponoti-saundersi (nom. inval.)]